MRALILLILLLSCTTAQIVEIPVIEKHQPAYKVGQCFLVFDPETGKSHKWDIVRVEDTKDKYTYRWFCGAQGWALDLNTGIGKYETFESMTREVPCPHK